MYHTLSTVFSWDLVSLSGNLFFLSPFLCLAGAVAELDSDDINFDGMHCQRHDEPRIQSFAIDYTPL